jgi:ABC-2 type transport system ATP-binding protein
VLADASVDELLTRASGDRVLLRSSAPADAAEALQQAGAAATVTDRGTVTVTGIEAHRVVEVLSQAGVAFSEVATQRASLEDVYFQLTGGEAEFHAGADGRVAR